MEADGATIGIVGATGWLGGALGRNLLGSGRVTADRLVLLNRRGPTDDYADWPGVTWARDAATLAASCDVVVLAVRPEDFPPAGLALRGRLVLSFMAGVPLDLLSRTYPGNRFARAMPGGGATAGRAHVPWVGERGLGASDAALVGHLLAALGAVDRVATEDELDYLTALSGSGAAYPALMAEAMLADARARGVSEEVALRAVTSVVCHAPELMRNGAADAAGLIEAYRAYRGPTAAGLDAAVAAGFAEAVFAALRAAAGRAAAMSADRAAGKEGRDD